MKIILAGGSGFIGSHLIPQLLAAEYSVVLLSRTGKVPALYQNQVVSEIWDGKNQGDWAKTVDGAEAVINLCGEGIANHKWDDKQKALLHSSRIEPTRALVQAIRSAKVKPRTFINISAVGFYGSVSDKEADEVYPQGQGFLPDLCADWEAAAWEVEKSGVRLVLPRIGVVIGKQGALSKMIPPFMNFIGGPLGSGKQWFPWVHIQDVVSSILFLLKNESIAGPVNISSPRPIKMREFCGVLGHVLHRPCWLPVPVFILRALLGEMSEMLTEGQRVVPKKLIKAGYKFRYALLESALVSIINPAAP